jgi:hypothetical protein
LFVIVRFYKYVNSVSRVVLFGILLGVLFSFQTVMIRVILHTYALQMEAMKRDKTGKFRVKKPIRIQHASQKAVLRATEHVVQEHAGLIARLAKT